MESFCFGVFLLVFFAGAALLAAPIASAVTAFVAKRQGTQVADTVHRRAKTIGTLTFIAVMLLACIGLWIWDPKY